MSPSLKRILIVPDWTVGGLFLVALLLSGGTVAAQPAKLIPINDPLTEFLLQQRTAGHLPNAHLTHLPLSGGEATRYLDSLAALDGALSSTQRQLLAQYRRETDQPGAEAARSVWGNLYANGHDALAAQGSNYRLRFNPLIYLSAGPARYTTDAETGWNPSWQASAGFQVSGTLGERLFFDARMEENVRRLPRPANVGQRSTTLPRQEWVRFAEGSRTLYEYWDVTGVAGYRTDYLELRFGHTRNRWGYGKNSALLSNYAPEYDQLQLRVDMWRLQYTNIFARFLDYTTPHEGSLEPSRYGAFRRVDLNVSDRVSVSLFESIIFGPDSLSQRPDQFELAYLNPLLFYQAAEANLGAPDNAFLGAGGRVRVIDGMVVYGQLMLDEFSPGDLVAGNGSWKNKWGLLAGLHLTRTGIEDLSLRMEFGQVRPYTYSHRTSTTSYVHAQDLLGYPTGPNNTETALFLRYRPSVRLRGGLNLSYTWGGRNTASKNWGSDPLRTYYSRVRNKGNWVGQGVAVQTLLGEAFVGYQLLPDLWIEGALRLHSVRDEETGLDRQVEPLIQLRWNRPFESQRW